MSSVVILVHGRKQQNRDPQELEWVWENALLRGLERARRGPIPRDQILFPFYGHLYTDYATRTLGSLSTAEKQRRLEFGREFARQLYAKLKKTKKLPKIPRSVTTGIGTTRCLIC